MTDALTVSLTFHDLTPDMAQALLDVAGGKEPAKAAAKPATKATPAKKAEEKKEAAKPSPKKEEPKADAAPTRDDVKAALTAFRAEHGQDEAVKIIHGFAKSISTIPEDKFAEVIAICEANEPISEEDWD